MRQYRSRLGLQGGYPASSRRGFTLIELLIVMVIILLLSGMLLGAVILVRRQVVKAQQIAELTQIDIAMTNFKAKYGIYPPSRIRLRNWNSSSPIANSYALQDPFDAHSVAYLRRIWPSIKLPIRQLIADTTLNVESPNTEILWYADNSGSGATPPASYDLEGDQCLVFFLGGIAERRGPNEFVLHGFTDDPANPSNIPNTSPGYGRTLTRIQPFFPFDASRLYLRFDNSALIDTTQRLAETDITTSSGTIGDFYRSGGNQPGANNLLGRLPSYKVLNADTSAPMPVAYFSSYEGRGYRPDDLNIPDPVNAGTGLDSIGFQLIWPAMTGTPQIPTSPTSMEPNPYSRNAADPTKRTGAGAANSIIQCYNPKTYQLILPGSDNLFGAGGSQLDYQQASWSENEDNLSNFSGGTTIGDFVTQQQK